MLCFLLPIDAAKVEPGHKKSVTITKPTTVVVTSRTAEEKQLFTNLCGILLQFVNFYVTKSQTLYDIAFKADKLNEKKIVFQ